MEKSGLEKDSSRFISPERLKRQDYNRIFTIWAVLILLAIGFFIFFPDIALRIEGKNWRVPYMAGEQAIQAENWVEAKDAFSKVIELTPEYSYGYLQLGNALLKLNETDKAESNFKKCLTLEPDQAHIAAHRNLGNIYYSRKDYETGIEHWQAATRLDGTNDNDYINLAFGMMHLPGYEPQEAIDILKKAQTLKADRYQTYNLLGYFYFKNKDFADAMSSWKDALLLTESGRERPYLHMRLGQCAKELGDLEGALRYLETAMALDPGNNDIRKEYQSLKSTIDNSEDKDK